LKEYSFRLEEPGEADLAALVERLGVMLAYYRGSGGSTYERTKEVWGALQSLLRISEKKWGEWIPLLAARYTPGFGEAAYFRELLEALLRRFAEDVRGYNPAMKRELAKAVRDALDSVVASPYPQLCFFVKEFRPERLCDERFRERCKGVVNNECE